ncbi:DUF4251 domain-containing protein [Flavobacterium laiguense]|nr:DUF4251 domain-containing protein [Flavobacterium laiguense]
MKTPILSFFLSFSMLIGFAQEKTKQQIKEEKKTAKQKEIEALVDSKEYEFQAITAYPMGGRSIDMITNPNFLRFKKDSIDSAMPYFGRAYSGVAYSSGGGGLDFKGPIQDYSIKKGKKEYTIRAKVKGNADSYDILLSVFFEGTASLSISSNNRSSISYRGSIEKLKAK